MSEFELKNVDFGKNNGLVPAIIQDEVTQKVLMLGYMNQEALDKTLKEKKVTFFSRTKNRLWTKGETSGHFLYLKSIALDCDQDALLIKVTPDGPTCHTGADTCWKEENHGKIYFLQQLSEVIKSRKNNPDGKSYTSSLFAKGTNKVAQKVGEEAVELVIEAMDNNDELFKNEAADLMFHLLVLLEQKNIGLDEVLDVLIKRHK
ncbi:bifunctional phosphoribosyl-AMP cyclohydrolase/phosphoribosyl-ATP diphosphatase HisIE [Sporocytophaga myxococcoides]|uniref:bifunctional phosphoribosyl-AMP cyclohydrolase/phosphoribosyl-ATP diphosphatase HisIE n=1 Tax=Sporocytophaga myxococcoides TaxID=153721 RepID=UPI00040D93F6|nr:bifunctional phosphoribosyl-AMP cyclohydrolase/phosphoribosyl-ATP diphosphatase HisIE [Sporocytophaga myxococcoides]